MDQDISSHGQRKWAESKSFILFKQIEAESSGPQCGSALFWIHTVKWAQVLHSYSEKFAITGISQYIYIEWKNKPGKFKTNQAC